MPSTAQCVAFGLAYIVANAGHAQPSLAGLPEETKLVVPGLTNESSFGAGIAVCGSIVAIGAPRFFAAGKGEVYTFEGSQEHSVLTPSVEDSFFGMHVAVDELSLAVAGQQGTYLYSRRDGVWAEDMILPVTSEALALDNGRLVLGRAPVATLIYARDPMDPSRWSIEAMLLPSDGMPTAKLFGRAVASEGNTVVIGASASEGGGQPMCSPGTRMGPGKRRSSWMRPLTTTRYVDSQ